MRSSRVLLILIIFLLLLAGCGGGGSGGGGNKDGNNTLEPKISPNALVFDDKTAKEIESIDANKKEIVLGKDTDKTKNIKQGSIIVIPITQLTPDGMLIKVTSVRKNNGKVIIQYENATLTELIEQGEIVIPQTQLTSDDIDVIEVEDESGNIEVQKPSQIMGQNVLGYTISGSYSSALTIRANVNISIGYNFKARIKSFSLNYLRATAKASEKAKVIAIARAGARVSFKKRIGRIKFKPVTIWVGWVPVYVRPVIYFYIGGSAGTQVAARTSITQTLSYEAGIQYTYSGGWAPVSDLNKGFSFSPPSMTKGNLKVRGYVQPKLVFWIYGATGPYLGVDGYLLLTADALKDPWCELRAGIQGFTGAQLVIFRKTLANIRMNLFDVYATLYECEDPRLIVSPATTLNSRGPESGSFSPASITFTLSSSNQQDVQYEVKTDVNWLDISNPTGTASSTNPVNVVVAINQNANSLKEGVYTGTVAFTNLTRINPATNKPYPPQTRLVTLVVRKQSFTVFPDSDAPLLGSDIEGGNFANAGQVEYKVGVDIGSVNWVITQKPAWVDVSPLSGTVSENAPQTVTVSVNTTEASSMPVGSHKGKITFVAKDKDGNVVKEETRTVYLQVKMKVTPTTGQQFDFPEGGPDDGQNQPWVYSVHALNGDVSFEAYLTQNWLNINNKGASIVDTATQGGQKDLSIYKEVSKLQSLKKGTYKAELKIENPNSGAFVDVVTIPFTVNIVDPFNVSPSQLSFRGPVGGNVSPSSGTFTVSSDFDNIEIQITSDQSWVQVSPSTVTVSKNSPQDVTVTIGDVSGLSKGTYVANITFTKISGGKQIKIIKKVVLTLEEPRIIWLGTLAKNPDALIQNNIWPLTTATAMSSDASVVVGYGTNDNGEQRAFMWANGTMQELGTLGGADDKALGVSGDGKVIVGVSKVGNTYHAFRWINGNMQDLGDLIDGTAYSEARDISADGNVIVGWSRAEVDYQGTIMTVDRAFIWTPGGGMQDLGTIGGLESRANAVSDNGTTVVGWSLLSPQLPYTHAFKWSGGVMQDLGIVPDDAYAVATDVSSDGSVVVGYYGTGINQPKRAFMWKNGTFTDLGDLGTAQTGLLKVKVSGDGSVVVGAFVNSNGKIKAFIWMPGAGMQELEAVYQSLLTTCDGFKDSLTEAVDISPDGRYILGTGERCGYEQPFIIDRVGTN